MFDILHKMVHTAEMAVRRIIAEQLSCQPDAPRTLIKLLANDEIEVAYFILHDSAMLEDEDQIEVIRHRARNTIWPSTYAKGSRNPFPTFWWKPTTIA